MIASLKNYDSILFLVLEQGFASIADALLENNTLRSLYLKLVAHKPSAFTRDATTNMHIKLWTVDIVFESILLINCILYSMYSSGNYGGPLGASSLAKGVVGNKSLRVLLDISDYVLPHCLVMGCFVSYNVPWKPDTMHSAY